MQDSIYHMTLKLHSHLNFNISPLENVTFLWTSTLKVTKRIQVICIVNPLVDYRFQCMSLLHSQTTPWTSLYNNSYV